MRYRAVSALFFGLLAVAVGGPATCRAEDGTAAQLTDASSSIVDGKSEVDGVAYHYLLARGGPKTVVLLHGWGTTSYMWRYVMPQLMARGYTVIAPDLRGLGDTAKPALARHRRNFAWRQSCRFVSGHVEAEEDIIAIAEQGARMFGVDQAKRYHDELFALFDMIAANPRIARERDEIKPPVRIHPFKAHLIVYRVEDDEKIFVVRIRHGHEDWASISM